MTKKILTILIASLTICVNAQQFEPPVSLGEDFTKVKANVGGDFALQYQILRHEADSALIPLGTGINLPSANFNLDVELAGGIKLNLVTYLSSRHHNDTWVKGGYLQIDELPFIKSTTVDRIMDYLTLWIGDMEINYGDEHFRRSDNGYVTRNPFVGNYLMDAFMTSPSMEVMFRDKGILAMGGITAGTVNPVLTKFSNNKFIGYNATDYLAFYWKAGYDRTFSDDLRTRLTLSGYHTPKHYSGSLYNGDRAGSRYYLVMNRVSDGSSGADISSNFTSGNFGPGTTNKDNSYMVNLYVKNKVLEFFGTYESAKGTYSTGSQFKFYQLGGEAIYHFGGDDQFYGGARYDFVNGDIDLSDPGDRSAGRFQVAAGWFPLTSTVLKLEYVNQDYNRFTSLYGENAGFHGFMVEAAISF